MIASSKLGRLEPYAFATYFRGRDLFTEKESLNDTARNHARAFGGGVRIELGRGLALYPEYRVLHFQESNGPRARAHFVGLAFSGEVKNILRYLGFLKHDSR